MNLVKPVERFCKKLKKFNVNFETPSPYHVQVMEVHNFYPTKNTYYNTATGGKGKYPDFKNNSDFMEFLRDQLGNHEWEERKKSREEATVSPEGDVVFDDHRIEDANDFLNDFLHNFEGKRISITIKELS